MHWHGFGYQNSQEVQIWKPLRSRHHMKDVAVVLQTLRAGPGIDRDSPGSIRLIERAIQHLHDGGCGKW